MKKILSVFLSLLLTVSFFSFPVKAIGSIKNFKIDGNGEVTWDPYPGAVYYTVSFSDYAGGNQTTIGYNFRDVLIGVQAPSGAYKTWVEALDENMEVIASSNDIIYQHTATANKARDLSWNRYTASWSNNIIYDKYRFILYRDGVEILNTEAAGHSFDTYPYAVGQDHHYTFAVQAMKLHFEDSDPVYSEPVTGRMIERIKGSDRYETSWAAADELRQNYNPSAPFGTLVLASGENFPDALSGAYLANTWYAPLLLINQKSADKLCSRILETTEEGRTIYVLGGEGALPSSWIKALEGKYKIKRLSGKDRYQTNMEILKEAGFDSGELLVCTGKDFADSLSASATGRPIFLVGKALTAEQKTFLEGMGDLHFTIIGGSNAVSQDVISELASYGKIERTFSGKTRYETSRLIAGAYFKDPDTAVIATGKDFPDGLSGGPLAYSVQAPLLLVKPDDGQVAYEYVQFKRIPNGYVLGGSMAVGDEVMKHVFRYLEG